MTGSGDDFEGDNIQELAVQALAHDDPDLQSIKEQMASADPKLRAVLEDYMARWFQYSHTSRVV